MPDKNDGNDPSTDSNGQSLPKLPVPPTAPQENEVGKQPKCCANQEEGVTAKLQRDIKTGEIWLIVINALLLIANIVIASIYYGQLCQMKKATKAAEGANTIARDALIATNRPWIKYAAQPGSDFRFMENQAVFEVGLTLTNIGHSVASAVTINTEIFVPSEGEAVFKEPEKRQKILCDRAASKPFDPAGFSLFPNDPTSVAQQVAIGNAEMMENARQFPKTGNARFIVPVVVGCIDYRYPPFPEHHQTGFIFELRRMVKDKFGKEDSVQSNRDRKRSANIRHWA